MKKPAAQHDLKHAPDSDIQGEGNVEAGRRYDQAQREFVKSGQVPGAAERAKPRDPAEAQELERAEEAGRSHAKGEDPAVRR